MTSDLDFLELDLTFERDFRRTAQPDVLAAPRPVYAQLAAAHLETYLGVDQPAPPGHRGRGARARAAGERLAGAPLVDAQLQVSAVDDLEEPRVHTPREAAVPLDRRSQRADRRRLDRGDHEHRVRVTERDRADLERAAADLERIGIALPGRVEGQRARIEVRDTHVDGNARGAGDLRLDHAGGALERHPALARRAAPVQQRGDAARA